MRVAVCLHVRVFHGNPPDVLRSWNYVPVKSEAVQSTENISFFIKSSDCQMLAISSAELPESWEDLYPINFSYLDLSLQHFLRVLIFGGEPNHSLRFFGYLGRNFRNIRTIRVTLGKYLVYLYQRGVWNFPVITSVGGSDLLVGFSTLLTTLKR